MLRWKAESDLTGDRRPWITHKRTEEQMKRGSTRSNTYTEQLLDPAAVSSDPPTLHSPDIFADKREADKLNSATFLVTWCRSGVGFNETK